MKCSKCGSTTKITDTRCSTHHDTALLNRARLYVGNTINFRVRRHRCAKCKYSFDTIEVELKDLHRIKKVASNRDT
jgi:transcriptional regulator NrdR family protein